MLKASCNKGDVEITVKGDIVEKCADILTIINSIYTEIFKDDIIEATFFRDFIEDNITDSFVIIEEKKDE